MSQRSIIRISIRSISFFRKPFRAHQIIAQTILNNSQFSINFPDVVIPSQRMQFFSSEKEQTQKEQIYQDPKEQIFLHALNHVNTYGWSNKALQEGAIDAGFPSPVEHIFPQGPVELVNFFLKKASDNLVTEVEKQNETFHSLNPSEKLFFVMKIYLGMIAPYIATWSQVIGLTVEAKNLPNTLTNLANVSDQICALSGRRSSDMKWYFDRATVTGIYISTVLFMLSDRSENFSKTWEFLQQRIDEINTLDQTPQNIQGAFQGINVAANSISSTISSLAQPLASQLFTTTSLGGFVNFITETTMQYAPSEIKHSVNTVKPQENNHSVNAGSNVSKTVSDTYQKDENHTTPVEGFDKNVSK